MGRLLWARALPVWALSAWVLGALERAVARLLASKAAAFGLQPFAFLRAKAGLAVLVTHHALTADGIDLHGLRAVIAWLAVPIAVFSVLAAVAAVTHAVSAAPIASHLPLAVHKGKIHLSGEAARGTVVTFLVLCNDQGIVYLRPLMSFSYFSSSG